MGSDCWMLSNCVFNNELTPPRLPDCWTIRELIIRHEYDVRRSSMRRSPDAAKFRNYDWIELSALTDNCSKLYSAGRVPSRSFKRSSRWISFSDQRLP